MKSLDAQIPGNYTDMIHSHSQLDSILSTRKWSPHKRLNWSIDIVDFIAEPIYDGSAYLPVDSV